MSVISLGGVDWQSESLFLSGPDRSFLRQSDDFIGIAEGIFYPGHSPWDMSAFCEDALQAIYTSSGDLLERFYRAAERIGPEAKDKAEEPSCSIAVATSEGKNISLAALGSCRALIETKAGEIELLCDTRPEPWDRAVARAIQVDLSQGLGYPNAAERVTKLIREHSRKTRQPDTPWYFAADPLLAFELEEKTFSSKDVRSLLIYNEGLAGASGVFSSVTGIEEEKDLLGECKSGIESLGKSLRTIQEQDPETERFMRMEPTSDIAAVLLQRD